MSILEIIARSTPATETIFPAPVVKRCMEHFEELPCARCAEDEHRGYAVLMLAGRCANGSELDHGSRWHAVRPGEYKAVCGAQPGRRSAGWSSYTVLGQLATCPRCVKKLQRA